MTAPRTASESVAATDVVLGAGHEFTHGADVARSGQRRALGWALGLNSALLVLEVGGGIAFGSLALLADAAHLVSDVAGLAIAWGAVVLAARPVSRRHSFGFARAEVLAAQVSALLLLAAGVWILIEAVGRLGHPFPVDGAGLAAVAAVGLGVNAGSALLVHRSEGASLNMRASFVHLATDAVGSLAAVIAGLMILSWGWLRADSLASIGTSALVLWAGAKLLRDTTHVLMEGTPRGMDVDIIRAAILDVGGITDVHHLHLWNLASDVPTLTAHVVVGDELTLREAGRTADRIRAALNEKFAIAHLTLEVECSPAGDVVPETADQPISGDGRSSA